ncbi:MAG TPA: acyl-CoA thioesterase [Myxococcota bacterium]|nr:acyl-CoA thioesterase [Myxococcota bacterium]
MRKTPPDALVLPLEVPFHDVDALRIVWHGHYLKYFELARTALMRARGLDVADVIALGYRQLVIESSCRHSFPLHYGDPFEVQVRVGELTHRIRFDFVVWNMKYDRRSARGSTTLVTTDADGNLLMETPHAIATRLRP